MTENLAVKNEIVDKARAELLKMGKISVPFLVRKFGLSYDTANEVFMEVMGVNV